MKHHIYFSSKYIPCCGVQYSCCLFVVVPAGLLEAAAIVHFVQSLSQSRSYSSYDMGKWVWSVFGGCGLCGMVSIHWN